MKKQRTVDFSFVDDYGGSIKGRFFEEKVKPAQNIEFAVLLGHVLLSDLLVDLLALRLRADTLPHRVPSFETLAGLTFAGSQFELEREIIESLNKARNEVGHRLERNAFEDSVRRFCQLLWEVNGDQRLSATDPFRWPKDESHQVLVFIIALTTLMPYLVNALSRVPDALRPPPN